MPPRHVSPEELGVFKLGVDSDELELESSDTVRAANVALVSQAGRYVDIVSRELDRSLYDRSDFLHALQGVLLGSARSRLRVLTQSIDRAVTYGHRLLDVARRMPSYVDIRLQSAEFSQYNTAFLVADRIGFTYREAANRFEGIACFNDRTRADRMMHDFEQMWLSARSHPDLRGFHL